MINFVKSSEKQDDNFLLLYPPFILLLDQSYPGSVVSKDDYQSIFILYSSCPPFISLVIQVSSVERNTETSFLFLLHFLHPCSKGYAGGNRINGSNTIFVTTPTGVTTQRTFNHLCSERKNWRQDP